jgi:hypothetical protein
VALVDREDYDLATLVGKWSARPNHYTVYAQRKIQRPGRTPSTIGLHVFLTGWPLVDHVNGNGLDNRRANLRPATHTQNNANARLRRDNRTGYKGVGQWGGRLPYVARIRSEGHLHYLGRYATPEDAARAYDVAAVEHFGPYARLNFPQEQT